MIDAVGSGAGHQSVTPVSRDGHVGGVRKVEIRLVE
jgi:hypothetical protein